MSIASINPTTGETLKEFPALDSQHIEEKLAKSVHAFEQHRRTSFAQRRTLMITVADLLEREREHLARIMTLEMGKLLRAAAEEITKCLAAGILGPFDDVALEVIPLLRRQAWGGGPRIPFTGVARGRSR